MDEMNDNKLHRRQVLKASGLAAGGAAGLAAVALTTSEAAASVPDGKDGTTDYAETDHVKTYYELARF